MGALPVCRLRSVTHAWSGRVNLTSGLLMWAQELTQPRMRRKEHQVCPCSENSTALRASQSFCIRDVSAVMHDLLRASRGKLRRFTRLRAHVRSPELTQPGRSQPAGGVALGAWGHGGREATRNIVKLRRPPGARRLAAPAAGATADAPAALPGARSIVYTARAGIREPRDADRARPAPPCCFLAWPEVPAKGRRENA
jgi:hypothetical protein